MYWAALSIFINLIFRLESKLLRIGTLTFILCMENGTELTQGKSKHKLITLDLGNLIL